MQWHHGGNTTIPSTQQSIKKGSSRRIEQYLHARMASMVLPVEYYQPEDVIKRKEQQHDNCTAPLSVSKTTLRLYRHGRKQKDQAHVHRKRSTGPCADEVSKKVRPWSISTNTSQSYMKAANQVSSNGVSPEGERLHSVPKSPQHSQEGNDCESTNEIQHIIKKLRSILESSESTSRVVDEYNRTERECKGSPRATYTSASPYNSYDQGEENAIEDQESESDVVSDTEREMNMKVKNFRKFAVRQYFSAWRNIIPSSRSKVVINQVDALGKGHFTSKRRSILTALSAVSIGADSRKKILQKRRERLSLARSTLTEKLERKKERHGIISTDMLHYEMQRIIHDELLDWDRKRYLQHPFLVMKSTMETARDNRLKAWNYKRKKLQYKAFICWRGWVITVSKGPPRFDPEEVDDFSKRRIVRVAFRSWSKLTQIYIKAARKRRAALTRLASKCFSVWYNEATHLRQLRSTAIQEWMNHGEYMMGDPFRNWRKWAMDTRNRHRDQERLLYVHCRNKKRRILRRIIRHWNSVVVYGRVTSMYSRKELLEKLLRSTNKVEELEGQIDMWSKSGVENG